MLDVMDFAYFTYMKEKEEEQTLNNRSCKNTNLFIGEEVTQKEDDEEEKDFSPIWPPHL